MKAILAALLLTALAQTCLAAAPAEQVTIEPKPLTAPLLNPGKGWSTHGLPKGQPKEVVDLAGMGVARFEWAALEPEEGKFNWQPLDQMLEAWGALGKVCNIGVMCASTHSRQPGGFVTPKWVFDAGAKMTEIDLTPNMSTQGTPGHKVAPVFDDPIFLAKLKGFLQAYAARYDGDPRIAVLDIRSYGNWGEAHMSPFKVPDISPEKFREHVQMHLDVFKKSQLCLSCNSHLGHYGALKPVFDWAVQTEHIAPRRDGICGNSDGRETAPGFNIAPGVFELYGNYDFMKERGWWDGKKDKNGLGFRLDECVKNGKPTWVDLGGGASGQRLIEENRELVDRLTNRIGYHFQLQRASYPRRAAGSFNIELTWLNQGVAPIYIPCAVALALIDSNNQPIGAIWPAELHPRQWMPAQPAKEIAAARFQNVPPGEYRLALAITSKAGDPKPYIRLGTDLPTVEGWYILGPITVAGSH